MRKNPANVQPMAAVMNRRDEPGFVPSDVKDRQFSDPIRTRECPAEFYIRTEVRMFHNPVPGLQSRSAIRVLFRELQQAFPGDDVHTQCVSRFEIMSSRQFDFDKVFVTVEEMVPMELTTVANVGHSLVAVFS